LIPHAAWWIACWYGRDGYVPGRGNPLPWISVDICTPPTLIDGEWTYIDLELDPHCNEDGLVWIDDEDEFAEACQSGLIPPDEQLAARDAANEVERLLRAREEPFGSAGWDKLREALSVELPPLTDLP
jgi:predicted RNA-binding protein associated with RNAse of E/G family